MIASTKPARRPRRYHTVGIGAGPANLSLAALFPSTPTVKMALFDRQSGPTWHDRLLHHGVRMQTSWLKDLVSLVAPQHELTFLNYLVTTGRLYALLNAQFDVIPRQEYVHYLAWAANRLDNVHYGVAIDRISFTDKGFVVYSDGRTMASCRHVVIAVGSVPVLPAGFRGLPGERVFIADELTDRLDDLREDLAAPVAVVGAGQTGIEAAGRLLATGFTDIKWFGRRLWFNTIDDSPVANDVYRPAHVDALLRLTPTTRRRIIEGLNPTGDALTPGAMRSLYQANYDCMIALGRFPLTLYPARDVLKARMDGDDVVLHCRTPGRQERHRARFVIVATGRETVPVPFDDDLRERVDVGKDGELIVDADFSVRWKGMNGHKIFALNRARMSMGLTDTNLTLLPVRAAIVLNSLFGREIYPVRDDLCPVNWG
jgi:lysine N6-hydroxylase